MSEVPTEAIHHAAVAWRVLAATAPQRSVAELVGSGILLGLPIARLPEAPIEPPSGLSGLPVRADRRPSSSASAAPRELARSEEHPSALQSLMRISYAVF